MADSDLETNNYSLSKTLHSSKLDGNDHKNSRNLNQQTLAHLKEKTKLSQINATSTNTLDSNPLLSDVETFSKPKRPQIVRRSPKFTQKKAKIYPLKEDMCGEEMEIKRSLSVHFKRSVSKLEVPYDPSMGNETDSKGHRHRRSQSYGSHTDIATTSQPSK